MTWNSYTIPPFAECGQWFGKHPGHAVEKREFDFAGIAIEGVVGHLQRRLVATRAGKEFGQICHGI